MVIRWLVSDQLGTPRMILDQSGNLANTKRHDYLPFGQELAGGTVASPGPSGRTGGLGGQGYDQGDMVTQKFTQKEWDNETGLNYFGARYFSSKQEDSAVRIMLSIRRPSIRGYSPASPVQGLVRCVELQEGHFRAASQSSSVGPYWMYTTRSSRFDITYISPALEFE